MFRLRLLVGESQSGSWAIWKATCESRCAELLFEAIEIFWRYPRDGGESQDILDTGLYGEKQALEILW